MRVVALKNMEGVPWGTYGTAFDKYEYQGQRYILVKFDNDRFLAFGDANHPLISYKNWIRIVED